MNGYWIPCCRDTECERCGGSNLVWINVMKPKRTILGAVIWYSILAALVTTAAILLFRR